MERLRRAIGVLGELFITGGVIVLLFAVWQIGYVGITEGRAQTAVAESVEVAFAEGRAVPPRASTGPDETVVGLLRVPRLGGSRHVLPIYEGTTKSALALGIGHYAGSARPGEIGNLGLAGHRLTHGNPLVDIDAIAPGDVVVVETRESFFVYRVVRHTVVLPSQTEVVAPVPERPGARPTEAWLTLMSCTPKHVSTHRYIVFARLEATYSRAQGLPPGVLADPRGV